jgi:TRAP-type C4-dicarboxylate transport system permease small subunit
MTTWEGASPPTFSESVVSFVSTLENAKNIIVKCVLAIAGIFMAVLLTSVFMQVVFRYVLRRPLSWSEELARYTFVWISLLGAAAVIPKSLTQGIDLLVKQLPESVQMVVGVITRLLMAVFCAILAFKGYELTGIVHMQTSAAMSLPMSYVYFAVPVSAVLMIVILYLDSVITYRNASSQNL